MMDPATGIWSVSLMSREHFSGAESKHKPFWSLFGHFAELLVYQTPLTCAQTQGRGQSQEVNC